MIYSEILTLENILFSNCDLKIKEISTHKESKSYSAGSFTIHESKIIFRKSKITPKKQGQFVTFWKRSTIGTIQPYHENDDFDYFMVTSYSENNSGIFIFPKSILVQHNILSTANKEGKRAFRVYPFWEKPIKKQAINTQFWQKKYFFLCTDSKSIETIKNIF